MQFAVRPTKAFERIRIRICTDLEAEIHIQILWILTGFVTSLHATVDSKRR